MLVLDGFGGAHPAGALTADPPGTVPPYFGFDIARAIVRRDVPPRIATASSDTGVDIDTIAPHANLQSVTIYAPTDGYLHVTGTAYMACVTGTGADLAASLSVNVDSILPGTTFGHGLSTWAHCVAEAGYHPTRNQTVLQAFPVSAGLHEAYVLGAKIAGTGTLRFIDRTVTAHFVAADGEGSLAPAVAPTAMRTYDESLLRPGR